MITTIPRGGLANRMRVLASLRLLVSEVGHPARIIWIQDKFLNCRLDELFGSLEFPVKETTKEPWLIRHYPKRKRIPWPFPGLLGALQRTYIYDHVYDSQASDYITIDRLDLLKKKHKKHLVLDTCNALKIPGKKLQDHDYSFLKPIPELQERIEERTKNFNDATIGVHVRRGDFPARHTSEIAIYIKYLNQTIYENEQANFYLCTDDEEVKQHLIDEFGDRIITNNEEAVRTSTQGVQQALVELYSLSKTNGVIGTAHSSFSFTAAKRLNKVPFTMVKTKDGEDKTLKW